jgi:hypothetical protein
LLFSPALCEGKKFLRGVDPKGGQDMLVRSKLGFDKPKVWFVIVGVLWVRFTYGRNVDVRWSR